MGPFRTFDAVPGLLPRRRWLVGAVLVLGTVLAVLHALSLPVVYEAVAVVQIEADGAADAPGVAMPGPAALRLQAIEQRLTTRDGLQAIIDRHGLYAGQPLSGEERLGRTRQAIRFQPIAAASAPGEVSALMIFARAATADLAARVANDLAQGVVDAGATGKTGQRDEAPAALASGLARIEEEIRALDTEVSAFTSTNLASLPEMRDVRRNEISATETELRRLDQALLTLRAELDGIGPDTDGVPYEALPRRIAAISRDIDQTQSQRNALAAQRAALVETMARIPEVERSLAAYDRRMAQLRVRLDVATRRLAEAEIAQKPTVGRNAGRFVLLDRAVSPEAPIATGRGWRVMIGFVASLILGIAAALLMDSLHPVIRTGRQMERQLGLLPLVEIPALRIAAHPARAAGAARDAQRGFAPTLSAGLAHAVLRCRRAR